MITRYRRREAEVEAVRFDGSERAAREISRDTGTQVAIRRDGIEIVTAFGRALVRPGQWLVRDRGTGVATVCDDAEFGRHYETIDPARSSALFSSARVI